MIASRLMFTPKDMVLLKMTDPYSLHRVVYSCFPLAASGGAPHAGRGHDASFLYVDNGIRNGLRQVVMLSHIQPEAPRWGYLESKPLPDALLKHNNYRFWLTMNPVKRENASRKIIPIRGLAVREWFCARAPSWGFSVEPDHVEVAEQGVWKFVKKDGPVTLAFAKLSGTLQVTDTERFKESFCKGIGRGKAFGLGMLQIIPIRRNATGSRPCDDVLDFIFRLP